MMRPLASRLLDGKPCRRFYRPGWRFHESLISSQSPGGRADEAQYEASRDLRTVNVRYPSVRPGHWFNRFLAD